MEKLNLGTIGTSWITDSFIQAALDTGRYELKLVYSRNTENGKEFGSKYGDIAVETDLDTFVNNEDLDVIYIASPNSLHYEQAMLALKAKKHVMVEKPASTNVDQWDDMLRTAKENNVFVLEAARHMHIPNLEKISEEVTNLEEVLGAVFSFAKYSSKYDSVLAGEEPNIFSLKFAGGALMDLGVYPVYTSVALFGEPKEAIYYPRKVRTGVDGIGTVILRYEDFDVTILIGKIASSFYEAEIYGLKETLIIDQVTNLNEAKRVDHKTLEEQEVSLEEQHENNMFYEAEALARMIETKDDPQTIQRYKELSDLARIVSGLLNKMLTDAGITFE